MIQRFSTFVLLLFAASVFAAGEEEGVAIPANIVTSNVPPLPLAMAERLQSFANTRGAVQVGWQDDAMLILTRFAETAQLHRVAQPLGYREQLTFLDEPVAEVALPASGVKDKLILSWDVGGSEFDQLFVFDMKTRQARMVSDGSSLYGYAIWAPDEERFVYVTTERNGRNWDIHVQNLEGEVDKVLETEDGYWFPIDWSPDGRKLLVRERISINESKIYELEVASRKLTPLLGHEQTMSVANARYDNRGGVIYTADADSEFLRLHRLDLASGETRVLTADTEWDVENFALAHDYSMLVFSVNEGGISKLNVWSLPTMKPLKLPELPAGIINGFAVSPDLKTLGVSINSATSPADIYAIDLKRRKLERWTRSEVGGLDTETFVDAQMIDYPTFDGRDVPAFIYRPRTPGPHPVVVLIHGGPEAQYRPYFSTTVQSYVTEMGVAVIAPNVRGSAGYGKSYLKLDNGYLREDSVKDIGALLDWIGTQDDLNAERVAVFGGSYGGYMVLASMVHYGDRLAAAVESVGISNFVTFLENTQAYRQDIRRVEYGDERDPKMREFLTSISPLTHVDKMQTPLLISQGANDPRVPASESDQIFAALSESGVPVWYILAKDEGHGFRKKVNRDYDQAAKFAFLEAYLKAE